jgi:hypothetical protein
MSVATSQAKESFQFQESRKEEEERERALVQSQTVTLSDSKKKKEKKRGGTCTQVKRAESRFQESFLDRGASQKKERSRLRLVASISPPPSPRLKPGVVGRSRKHAHLGYP